MLKYSAMYFVFTIYRTIPMWKFLHAFHINEHKVKPYKSYLKYSTQTHIKCAIYLHRSMSNNQIHQSQKCTSFVEWILLCRLSTFPHTHAHHTAQWLTHFFTTWWEEQRAEWMSRMSETVEINILRYNTMFTVHTPLTYIRIRTV